MKLTLGARSPIAVVAAASMFAAIGVAWLPWVRTGSRNRNSYEVFRSAQRLGLEELTPLRVVWFVVPVVAAAAVVAGMANRVRIFGVLTFGVGLVVAVAGLVVAVSGLGAGLAPVLAACIGLVALVAGGLLARNSQGSPYV